mmetsp:Transcript_18062/g.33499  ORF Transcript_18062/g.33499 Transcript_18062/m.33499 type:complete len:384 (+) Transcript_18062:857-2008(+)
MREKSMTINLITYNSAITALAKASKQKAKLGQLSDTNEDPEEGLWQKALNLLDQMKEDGIEPDGFSYSSAISCCVGRWEEACELIEIMKQNPTTRPNKIAYTAAIGKSECINLFLLRCARDNFFDATEPFYSPPAACGQSRNPNPKKAIELFETMKKEGIPADKVAYNSLFSALRVAKDATKTYELWREMCDNSRRVPAIRSSPAISRARGLTSPSPDIITVTDCIATLSQAGKDIEMDNVFEEAVKRGIVLRSNSLDLQWEVDLSGMPFAVARAACRYLLKGIKEKDYESADEIQDMIFITGIGKAHQFRRESSPSKFSKSSSSQNVFKKDPSTSLRDFIQRILETDFDPPLKSKIPERAKGTVVVERETLIQWLDHHKTHC